MEIRVLGGAAKGTQSLCESCGQAMVIKGFRESETFFGCWLLGQNGYNNQPPFPVAECNKYMAPAFVPKDELEKIALPIDGTHARVKGFKQGE